MSGRQEVGGLPKPETSGLRDPHFGSRCLQPFDMTTQDLIDAAMLESAKWYGDLSRKTPQCDSGSSGMSTLEHVSKICFPWLEADAHTIANMIWMASDTGELWHVFEIRDRLASGHFILLIGFVCSVKGVARFVCSKPPFSHLFMDSFDPCI